MHRNTRSLHQVVAERPFPEYQSWWPVGSRFTRFMAGAIIAEWAALPGNAKDLERVRGYSDAYVQLVYGRVARPGLVDAFADPSHRVQLASGEFDALSYAFFRAAFEVIAPTATAWRQSGASERRQFTKRVGRRFFDALAEHLQLRLPSNLATEQEFSQLKGCLEEVGNFLLAQGYLRTHFGFLFSLDVEHAGQRVNQNEAHFVERLRERGTAYALYEMGYPAILPSAVYLYNTLGEAQHHSSRTIEELFERIGYDARETDDFDPTAFASDHVVELWGVQRRT